MCVVSFDSAKFLLRYPEFTPGAARISLFFDEATLYLDNTDCSPVADCTKRAMLLNMLTAHIAAGNGADGSGAPSGIVGRISSVTEGTITVASEYASNTPGTMAWFLTTSYGAAFWQATAYLRTMRYVPGASSPAAPRGFGLPVWRRR